MRAPRRMQLRLLKGRAGSISEDAARARQRKAHHLRPLERSPSVDEAGATSMTRSWVGQWGYHD